MNVAQSPGIGAMPVPRGAKLRGSVGGASAPHERIGTNPRHCATNRPHGKTDRVRRIEPRARQRARTERIMFVRRPGCPAMSA
jgi:hypothetical protein